MIPLTALLLNVPPPPHGPAGTDGDGSMPEGDGTFAGVLDGLLPPDTDHPLYGAQTPPEMPPPPVPAVWLAGQYPLPTGDMVPDGGAGGRNAETTLDGVSAQVQPAHAQSAVAAGQATPSGPHQDGQMAIPAGLEPVLPNGDAMAVAKAPKPPPPVEDTKTPSAPNDGLTDAAPAPPPAHGGVGTEKPCLLHPPADVAQAARPDDPAFPGAVAPAVPHPAADAPPAPQMQGRLAPVQPDGLAQVIIRYLDDATDGVLELTLTPKELGPLRIEFLQGPDGLRVTLYAERTEAMDLIRRHAGDLLEELRQAGWGQASLNFGDWAQGQKPKGGNDDQAAHVASSAETGSPPAQPATIRQATGSGGLHLRL